MPLNFNLLKSQKQHKDFQIDALRPAAPEMHFNFNFDSLNSLIEKLLETQKSKRRRKAPPRDPLKNMIIPPTIL